MSLTDDVFPLLINTSRSIGTIIPDCVIEEEHRDQTIFTEHPVEMGASISDHAYQRPAELRIKIASTNGAGGTEGYVQIIYQEFLALKAALQPISVSTGKRNYTNMGISSLETTTTEETEDSLLLSVGLREVIIVSTQATGGAGASAQASPESTAPEVNTGTKVLTNTDRESIPGGIGGV